jgi:uncharacterized membrane protein
MDVRRAIPPAEELGESPLWPAAAILAAAVLYADLPSRFILGRSGGAFGVVRWVVPVLTLLVLASLAAIRPRGRLIRRRLVIGAIGIVSAANGVSIGLLIHLLINGAEAQASPLLRAAVHMWVVNGYWQLDGGGPTSRPRCASTERDFLFPQQTEPALLERGWRPLSLDYLYMSVTNASAFSPTDTLPLSRWAKMLVLVQSALSLALAVMVVARAVNILR